MDGSDTDEIRSSVARVAGAVQASASTPPRGTGAGRDPTRALPPRLRRRAAAPAVPRALLYVSLGSVAAVGRAALEETEWGLAASSQRSGTPPSGRSRARRAGRGGLRGARREGGARTGCLPLPLSPRGWTKTAMPVARARPSYKARRARAATPILLLAARPSWGASGSVPCAGPKRMNCMRFYERTYIGDQTEGEAAIHHALANEQQFNSNWFSVN